MIHKASFAIAAAALVMAPVAAKPAEARIRSMAISSRGVAFDLDVDGRVSKMLSSSGTGRWRSPSR